ncbi:unnamed protein product, partial [Prorocentrum cordatum]
MTLARKIVEVAKKGISSAKSILDDVKKHTEWKWADSANVKGKLDKIVDAMESKLGDVELSKMLKSGFAPSAIKKKLSDSQIIAQPAGLKELE